MLIVCALLISSTAYANGWTSGWIVENIRSYNDDVYIFVTDDVEFEKRALALAFVAQTESKTLRFGAFAGGLFSLIEYKI